MGWLVSNERAREMYAAGRADATALRFAHFWSAVIGLGLLPKRWVNLEVVGRRSGRVRRFPIGMADVDGRWYIVSMLGDQCNWVQNVRAAGGAATLRRRRPVPCTLLEVPVHDRAAILKRYLEIAPGARPHVVVDRPMALADFEAVASRYPVFRVEPAESARA